MFLEINHEDVNREERHYGFLFMAALLYNTEFTKNIFARLKGITGAEIDSLKFELYSEVSALRDYWNALGNPKIYTHETHQLRKVIIERLLNHYGYPSSLLEEHDFFWTKGKEGKKSKLWFPGKWPSKEVGSVERKKNELCKIIWSFNAQPDFLIVSNNDAVFIEVKLESNKGQSSAGYDQMETQSMIGELMKLLIPNYSDKKFYNTSLTLNNDMGVSGITWKEVIEDLGKSKDHTYGSEYILRSLKRLEKYYQGYVDINTPNITIDLWK